MQRSTMKKLCCIRQLLHISDCGQELRCLLTSRQYVPSIGKTCIRAFHLPRGHLHLQISPRDNLKRELTFCSNSLLREFRPPGFVQHVYHQKRLFCKRILHSLSMHSSRKGSLPMLSSETPYQFLSSFASSSSSSSFLKNQSALLVKRPSRKKIPKIHDEGKTLQVDNIVAYAVAEEIKLRPLRAMLEKQGLYTLGELPRDVEKVLHVRGKYNMDKKPKEIFVFEDGSAVFWCVPEIERGAFLKLLNKHSQSPYQTSLILYEREEMDFVNIKTKTGLDGDVIQLMEGDQESMEKLLELYTISNAMGQSVKLSMWEASLDRYVTSIVSVTEDLRLGRKIGMSRRQVLMKTGELFALKHLINLSSDLLDTPDFYWERSTLEPLYQTVANYLHMARRTRVMNEKLSHCCELTELLSTELNDAHHTRLEVMIIILILLEVIFEIFHFADRYSPLGSGETNSTSENLEEVNREKLTAVAVADLKKQEQAVKS